MQSVQSIVRAIENGSTTPTEAVEASLAAIDAKDDAIGAFVYRPARDADLAAAENAQGALAGVAIGIKDIFDTFDMPTECGTPIHAGRRPGVDAALVAMMRERGASIVGKTVTTEFAFLSPAATRNPRNPAHTPGGSSSGSAAAVAAGMVPAAIGTQTGGSIIRPAAYCGVAGYKPSFRLVPLVGAKAFSWSLDTAGFFAASVADVAEFVDRLSRRRLAVEPVEEKSLRIGLYRSATWSEASEEMREAVERAAAVAEGAGARVTEIVERDAFARARDAHSTIQNFEAAMALCGEYRRHGDRMSDVLRQTLAAGCEIAPDAYDDARRTARRARREATDLFDEVDVILTPSAAGAAPEGLASTGSPVFNKLWTLTGNPCINVPGVNDASGMPLGVQVVARFGRDRLALSAGHWLEQALRSS